MGLAISVLIGALAFGWTMWAVLFWGSIAIIERHNPYNTFGWALAWSAIEIVVSAAMGGIVGLGALVVWLVFLLRLLLSRYELGLLHAIGVALVTVAGPYFATDAFMSFVGSSATLFMIVLYGFPISVLVVWRWPRPAPAQPTNLPAARVARLWRRRAAPAAAVAATDAPVPAPAPAAPVASIAPPAPVAPAAPIAPPAPAPPSADGEPSFLR